VRPQTARYDGHAEWYDETFPALLNDDEESFLRECLGVGRGEICLDVACGTGRGGPAGQLTLLIFQTPIAAAIATTAVAPNRAE